MTAVRDADGNSLRPKMRVTNAHDEQAGPGTVVGISPPFSVSVEWDDDVETTERGVNLRLISKTGPPR